MRKRLAVPVLSILAVAASLLVGVPADAHGYISSPASRQANCAQHKTSFDCGDIVWEPQSVEAPKGSMQCNGGGSRFAILNDNSRPWPTTSVGNNVTFNWVLTARHRTSTWEYFVGSTRIGVVNDNGATPGATVSHNISLGGRTGRITVLARWNVYDTGNAFYSCVDLQVGGGGGGNPTPSPTPPTNPTPSPQPTSSPNPPSGTTWTAGTAYAVGATVTYAGLSYRCLQAHTALAGWEPPNTPALWQRV
ncbi:lytic polysaccharide monooxygenase [Catellatospora sp. KI3]|uniref:lytic polysaccharide monooxygenase n=1 Tax=Catellatospora sp. KI3 TaxID=3041620 RepID=UPI0024821E25|nr:lytic polysaccharide monooxygenase [Catellatospora sp. KI3]MDI1463009.1 lytic polysaccharide monooxygenase [Catellatospora sp. KI3]